MTEVSTDTLFSSEVVLILLIFVFLCFFFFFTMIQTKEPEQSSGQEALVELNCPHVLHAFKLLQVR